MPLSAKANKSQLLFTSKLYPVERLLLPKTASQAEKPSFILPTESASRQWIATVFLLVVAVLLGLGAFYLLQGLGNRYVYSALLRLGSIGLMVVWVFVVAAVVGFFSRR